MATRLSGHLFSGRYKALDIGLTIEASASDHSIRAVKRQSGAGIRLIPIQTPLENVAVHIVESPRIRKLLSDRMRPGPTIVCPPVVFTELGEVIAEAKLGRGPRAARILPLRFRGQTVGVARRQPPRRRLR